ncbi:uncharacterized protein LOC112872373, partial [Panicum hallii]
CRSSVVANESTARRRAAGQVKPCCSGPTEPVGIHPSSLAHTVHAVEVSVTHRQAGGQATGRSVFYKSPSPRPNSHTTPHHTRAPPRPSLPQSVVPRRVLLCSAPPPPPPHRSGDLTSPTGETMTTSRRLADRKTAKFQKNITRRGSVPETTVKKGNDYPVGPIVLGFFIFVVIGSSLFQIIRTATSGGMA